MNLSDIVWCMSGVSGGVWRMSDSVWWCLVMSGGVWSMSDCVNVYRLKWPELMFMGR